jgi:TetR/AcrR family transcriptional repressor of mexJK operon
LAVINEVAVSPPGRGKGRPRVADAPQIERAIREAAIDALLQHGDAATMHAIAQASGLSRKTLYSRYPNKGALFLAVLRDVLASASGVDFDRSGSLQERLFSYIRTALYVSASPPARAIQHLLMIIPDHIAALESEMKEASERHFGEPLRKLLQDAHGKGEVTVPDVDTAVEAIVALILAENYRGPSATGVEQEEERRERHARFLTDLLCHGLLPRPGGVPDVQASKT